MINKRQAKRWACGLVASGILANIDNGCYELDRLDQDGWEYKLRAGALQDLADELKRRAAKEQPGKVGG